MIDRNTMTFKTEDDRLLEKVAQGVREHDGDARCAETCKSA